MRSQDRQSFTSRLSLVSWSLLALMVLPGCSPIGALLKKEISTTAFLSPQEISDRATSALVWVQYRGSTNWTRGEVPLASVQVAGTKVGDVDTGQHGLLVLRPGRVRLSVTFTNPILGASSSKINTVRELKPGSIEVISFGPPVSRMNVCTNVAGTRLPICSDEISYGYGNIAWWVSNEVTPDLKTSGMSFFYREK